MMKKFKKCIALLLAAVMIFSMSAAAFAATISVGESDNNTYTIYQLLTGDVSDDGSTLSNVVAGKNLNSEIDAQTFADAIEELNDAEATQYAYLYITGDGTTLKAGETANVDAGYYLIVTNDGSMYILKILGDDDTLEIKSKTSGETTGDKKIVDSDKNDNGDDVAIGDKVQFGLTVVLPANFSDYTTYSLTLTDTMNGLDFVSLDTVTIGGITYKIENDEGGYNGTIMTDDEDGTEIGTWIYNEDENTLTIVFKELVDVSGAGNSAVVYIAYTAKVASDVGTTYNESTNTLEINYSNNPNDTSSYGNDEDEVYVYNFNFNVKKTYEGDVEDGDYAEFTLYSVSYDENNEEILTEIKTITGNSTGSYSWTGLADGDYVLIETSTPDGYVTADPYYFTIESEIDDNGSLISVTFTNENGEVISSGDCAGEVDIYNELGSSLPSTGGMGRTILYAIGIILILGAGIVLVVKRRAKAN